MLIGQFLAAVPKNRTDLLPHYARFIATLDRYMPDVGLGVIELVSRNSGVYCLVIAEWISWKKSYATCSGRSGSMSWTA